MLAVFVWIIIAIAGFMTIFGLTMRWAVRYVTQYVEEHQRAAQCIVEGRVPDDWAKPFLQRIEAMQAEGRSSAALERLGQRAQANLLRRLDSLTRYYERGGSFDSPQTRWLLLEALRERRTEWAAADWRSLLGLGESLQDTAA